MNGYALSRYAHVLVVVYLLGTDLGRWYFARAGATPSLSHKTRAFAARGVLALGTVTDIALIVIFPIGFLLASSLDAYHISNPAWRPVPYLLPALLIVTTFAANFAASRPQDGKWLANTDGIVRAVIGAGQVWDGVSVLGFHMTHMVEARWLAAKLVVYGILLLLSIPVRQAAFRLRRELSGAPLTAETGEPFVYALSALTVPMLVGWALILVASWLGIAQPTN